MNFKTVVLSLAVVGMLFTSCDDTKKKEAEAAAQEQMRLDEENEAKMKMEEEAAMKQAEFDQNTIAAKAMANEKYSTLVTALKSAELAETFMGEGEYTVFAPTNEAFSKVPKATLDNLMMAENKAQLQNLLKYHVVAGEYNAEAVMKAIADNNNKFTVTTLQGENLTLSVKDGKVMVTDAKGNTATVADADMDASNGMIHGIDKVLMPKA